MGIKSYTKNEQTFWKVRIEVRSKADPSIRVQKEESGIKTEQEAKRRERILKDEIHKEIYRREQTGGLFGQLVHEWTEALHNGTGTNRPIGPSTVFNYTQILRDYSKKWWKLPAAEITRADVRELLEELVSVHGQSPSARDRMRRAASRKW